VRWRCGGFAVEVRLSCFVWVTAVTSGGTRELRNHVSSRENTCSTITNNICVDERLSDKTSVHLQRCGVNTSLRL
jgi:hypothetical protein